MAYHGDVTLPLCAADNWKVVQSLLSQEGARRYGPRFAELTKREAVQARYTAQLIRGWMVGLNNFKVTAKPSAKRLAAFAWVQYCLLEWKEGRRTATRLTRYDDSLPVHAIVRRIQATTDDIPATHLYPALHHLTEGGQKRREAAFYIRYFVTALLAGIAEPVAASGKVLPKFLRG
jgi:hypothetical protein